MDDDALAFELPCDHLAHIGVLEREDTLGAVDQVHARTTEIAEDGGEFAADDARPDNDDALRQVVDAEYPIAGKNALLINDDIGYRTRSAAGGDDELVGVDG